MFRKAERRKAKARIAFSGTSGSGKTYSALLMAFGLGKKVAMIDTENGSGDLYAHLGEYDICQLQAPYEPEKYTRAIKAAEKAGYDVIVIDSLSHAWAGEGGLLDQHGKITDSGKGNSYTAWRTVTPKHNDLVESMLQSSCHIIATVRAKTEYVQQKNGDGKTEIKKVGLAPVQRDGLEYEMTTFLDIAIDHTATASKDRTGLFDGRFFKPSVETGKLILGWLESGVDAPPADTPVSDPLDPPPAADPVVSKAQLTRLYAIAGKSDKSADEVKDYLLSEHGIESSKDIPIRLYDQIVKWIEIPKQTVNPGVDLWFLFSEAAHALLGQKFFDVLGSHGWEGSHEAKTREERGTVAVEWLECMEKADKLDVIAKHEAILRELGVVK